MTNHSGLHIERAREASVEAAASTPEPARRITSVAGTVTIAIGCIALLGWLLSTPILTTFLPGLATMKANTALGIVLIGSALVATAGAARSLWPARLLAAGAVALGGATAAEYLTGRSLGIDEVLFRDPGGGPFPGRMSPATALAFVSAGVAILGGTSRRWSGIGLTAGVAMLGLALVALVGYLFDVGDLYRFGPFASVSLPTAAALAVAAVGILAARPEGPVRRTFAAGPGGELIRRLLPATIVFPIGLGLLVLSGSRAGLFGPALGIGLLVIGLVGTLMLLVYRAARALDGADSARRRVEHEARRSAERERIVAVAVADAIVTIDAHSTIRYANPAAARIFEYPPDSLVGRPLTVLMPERMHALHRAGLRRYMESGVRHISWDGAELTGVRSSGEEFPIDVSFAESSDGPERTFTGIIRDVSARKRLETQLVQAQRLESVGRLAGGVAHDFNNILTAMLGFNQLVLDNLPEDDPLRPDVLAIRDGGERASALVRQLLAFSRRQVLRPEVVSPAEVVEGIVPMIERLIGSHIEIVLGRMDPSAVHADRGQLEQVIVNLAVNARDAMPNGGRLTIEVTPRELSSLPPGMAPYLAPGPYVQLAVSDNGAGMDEVTRTHLFEPFFTTKGEGIGTGLGLATVYGIVQQSGGHIDVYSEPGLGSTFRILLPQAASDVAAAQPGGAVERRVASGSGERILVVEDEALIRDLIRKVLVRDGYVVTLADDAAAAMERLAAATFDLVLSDVVMPGRTGLDLAREIHERWQDLPVILMSGYSAEALGDFVVGGRPPALVEKPFSPESLLEAVEAALGRRDGPGQRDISRR